MNNHEYVNSRYGLKVIRSLSLSLFLHIYIYIYKLGALAEWLKGHPQYLVPIMNYIVPRLGDPKLSFYAASAFSNICDICRESLIDGLDSLMHVYGTTAASSIEVKIIK